MINENEWLDERQRIIGHSHPATSTSKERHAVPPTNPDPDKHKGRVAPIPTWPIEIILYPSFD